MVQRSHQSKEHPDEDTDSNQEVLGFKDIEKDAESEANIGSKDQGIVVVRSDEEWQNIKQHATRADSNFEMGNEEPEPEYAMPAASINSDTRTKIANFSHNGCSIEVTKDYTQLTTLGHGINGVMERNNEESLLEPPGFEKVAKVQSEHDVTQCPGVNMKCQPTGLNSISITGIYRG